MADQRQGQLNTQSDVIWQQKWLQENRYGAKYGKSWWCIHTHQLHVIYVQKREVNIIETYQGSLQVIFLKKTGKMVTSRSSHLLPIEAVEDCVVSAHRVSA